MSAGEAIVRFVGFVESVGDGSARVRVLPEYCEGLMGLEGFSHAIILYWLHKREGERDVLKVTPRRHPGAPVVGVFASRSPSRPNPIGLCVTKLLEVRGCTLTLEGLDALEGSPVLDIKPYLPRADMVSSAKTPEWASRGPPS